MPSFENYQDFKLGNIKIIKGVFDTKLELEHAGVAAGFPSPADDYRHETLDFNHDYIRHPEASFYGDVEGDSMKDAGLLDGDRVIIDRAVEPHDGSIVVAWWDGGFTMKFLDLTHRKDGYIELRPANPDYPVFKVKDPENFQIWGTVIHLIRTFEKLQETMYGIIDCDNCYCSCEKVFSPDLEGKPIVVLSNNDGCVVARSNEAKVMGIKAGTPYFQQADQEISLMKHLTSIINIERSIADNSLCLSVVNAVIGECIWNPSYNERRMAFELELTQYLVEEDADMLVNQFTVPADYDGVGSKGIKFVIYM